jgi:hypothetical protein
MANNNNAKGKTMKATQVITREVEIIPSDVNVGDCVAFHYNGDMRCLKVEKATAEFVQGRLLPWDDVLPTRRFASFRFDRITPGTGGLRRVTANSSEWENFDLADVR